MTTTTTGIRDHTIVGLSEQVATILRRYHHAGTLIAVTAPQHMPGTDRRIAVRVRLRHTAPTPTARHTPNVGAYAAGLAAPRTGHTDRRAITIAIVVAAVVGLTALAAYLAGQLLAFLASNAALLAGALTLAALTAALTGTNKNRRHAPGR